VPRAIRQLERDVGVDLFVRTTREVRLTDAGRAFLAGARRTLEDADRAGEDARRAGAGELGRLRIAFSWSTRFETLPALGRAFRASHPDVELLAQEMWNARVPPAFRNGSIDIALSLCPEIAAELELAPIRKERLVALLPETHPLAREEAIPLSAWRMRTSSCSRGRSHRGSTTRSWRSTAAPASNRESARSRGERTDRLARDLPGLARRQYVAGRSGIRSGRALSLRRVGGLTRVEDGETQDW
jgi:DNA-binding transcriptional LysR family regulator